MNDERRLLPRNCAFFFSFVFFVCWWSGIMALMLCAPPVHVSWLCFVCRAELMKKTLAHLEHGMTFLGLRNPLRCAKNTPRATRCSATMHSSEARAGFEPLPTLGLSKKKNIIVFPDSVICNFSRVSQGSYYCLLHDIQNTTKIRVRGGRITSTP